MSNRKSRKDSSGNSGKRLVPEREYSPFKCDFESCNFVSRSLIDYAEHRARCHPPGPVDGHRCPIGSCGFVFKPERSARKLTVHYDSIHLGIPHYCSLCGKRFKHRTYLVDHVTKFPDCKGAFAVEEPPSIGKLKNASCMDAHDGSSDDDSLPLSKRYKKEVTKRKRINNEKTNRNEKEKSPKKDKKKSTSKNPVLITKAAVKDTTTGNINCSLSHGNDGAVASSSKQANFWSTPVSSNALSPLISANRADSDVMLREFFTAVNGAGIAIPPILRSMSSVANTDSIPITASTRAPTRSLSIVLNRVDGSHVAVDLGKRSSPSGSRGPDVDPVDDDSDCIFIEDVPSLISVKTEPDETDLFHPANVTPPTVGVSHGGGKKETEKEKGNPEKIQENKSNQHEASEGQVYAEVNHGPSNTKSDDVSTSDEVPLLSSTTFASVGTIDKGSFKDLKVKKVGSTSSGGSSSTLAALNPISLHRHIHNLQELQRLLRRQVKELHSVCAEMREVASDLRVHVDSTNADMFERMDGIDDRSTRAISRSTTALSYSRRSLSTVRSYINRSRIHSVARATRMRYRREADERNRIQQESRPATSAASYLSNYSSDPFNITETNFSGSMPSYIFDDAGNCYEVTLNGVESASVSLHSDFSQQTPIDVQDGADQSIRPGISASMEVGNIQHGVEQQGSFSAPVNAIGTQKGGVGQHNSTPTSGFLPMVDFSDKYINLSEQNNGQGSNTPEINDQATDENSPVLSSTEKSNIVSGNSQEADSPVEDAQGSEETSVQAVQTKATTNPPHDYQETQTESEGNTMLIVIPSHQS